MPQLKTSSLRMGMKNLSETLPRLADETILEALNHALDELRKPGASVTYPINWDSEKQRRAFFATNGFGKGIPYKRTGKLNRSWRITRASDSPQGRRYGYYTIQSSLSYAKYVQGNARGGQQSNIHKGRWKLFVDIVRAAIGKLSGEIRSKLYIGGRKWA